MKRASFLQAPSELEVMAERLGELAVAFFLAAPGVTTFSLVLVGMEQAMLERLAFHANEVGVSATVDAPCSSLIVHRHGRPPA